MSTRTLFFASLCFLCGFRSLSGSNTAAGILGILIMTPNKKIAGFAFHAAQVLLTKDGQTLKEDRIQGPSPQSDIEVQGDILETMKRQLVASHQEQRRRLNITVACLEFGNNTFHIPGCLLQPLSQITRQVGPIARCFRSKPGSSKANLA